MRAGRPPGQNAEPAANDRNTVRASTRTIESTQAGKRTARIDADIFNHGRLRPLVIDCACTGMTGHVDVHVDDLLIERDVELFLARIALLSGTRSRLLSRPEVNDGLRLRRIVESPCVRR